MPWLTSLRVSTASSRMGFQKLGHPVPESYFVSLAEQRLVAHDAAIDPGVVVVPVDAGEGALGAGLLRDVELRRVEPFAQLVLAEALSDHRILLR